MALSKRSLVARSGQKQRERAGLARDLLYIEARGDEPDGPAGPLKEGWAMRRFLTDLRFELVELREPLLDWIESKLERIVRWFR